MVFVFFIDGTGQPFQRGMVNADLGQLICPSNLDSAVVQAQAQLEKLERVISLI